jgi:hypothetical protein
MQTSVSRFSGNFLRSVLNLLFTSNVAKLSYSQTQELIDQIRWHVKIIKHDNTNPLALLLL